MQLINFHAGPGAGKSVIAAYIYARMKMLGINCELVTEYAKDETWNENTRILRYQPKIAGEQAWRVERLLGKVDIVITDSPILLASVYASIDTPKSFMQYLLDEHHRFNSANFFVKRQNVFNQVGRLQNEEQSKAFDERIKLWYDAFNIKFDGYYESTVEDCEKCLQQILEGWHL